MKLLIRANNQNKYYRTRVGKTIEINNFFKKRELSSAFETFSDTFVNVVCDSPIKAFHLQYLEIFVKWTINSQVFGMKYRWMYTFVINLQVIIWRLMENFYHPSFTAGYWFLLPVQKLLSSTEASLHKKSNFYCKERNQIKIVCKKRDDKSACICRISIFLVVWLLWAF